MSHNTSNTTTTTVNSNSNTTTTTSVSSSITTTTTISCSTGFFTTRKECTIDPIVELFEIMVKGASNIAYSGSTYANVIARILDKGIIEENCDKCCPDCGNMYVFAGKEAFMDLAIAIGWAESAAVPA
jgi:hypothetical protein